MTMVRWHGLRWRIVVALVALGLSLSPAVAGKAKQDAKEKDDEKEQGLPLEPTRTIEFTTDEATWLSLDVSPDGTTLALELLGDLYTLPVEGGRAERITEGLPFDSQPRFSPDGEWIAFLSDRDGSENLWIAKTDGSQPKKLTQDSNSEFASPTWTPDGEYVVVSRSSWGLNAYELWSYHVKGGSGIQITKAKPGGNAPRRARKNSIGAVASPDERYFYYASRTGGFSYNAGFPMWQITRRDRVTGYEDTLTQAPGSAIRPLLSPDGKQLVYGTRFDSQTGLRIRDLETSEDRWLKYPVQRDDQEARFTRDLLPGYAFMPDGRSIVVSYGGGVHRVDTTTGEATEIPFTAEISQQLGPQLHFPRPVEEGPVRARLIQGPAQSPDGTRLAFSALTHLYVMDIPGGSPKALVGDDVRGFQPAWSPDGLWIAYVTWSTEGGHLWKVRSDGSTSPVRLTSTAAFYSDPAWSPDGTRIVALRGSAYQRLTRPFDFGQTPGMDLIWIPADGGAQQLVIPARGVGRPHFTSDEPDRIFLYLSSGLYSNEGPDALVSMRFDGTDRREHLKVTAPGLYSAEEPVPALEIRISPDGRWALAHAGTQLYVMAVPRVGGEPPTVNVTGPNLPLKKLTDVGADYFDWSADGRTITWAVGSTFFRQPFDSVSFEKKEDDDESDDKNKKTTEPEAVEAIEVVIEKPRHKPQGTIALRGARVVTMRGDEVIPEADIVVTDNRIAAVGAAGTVSIPRDARELDVKGTTIVPGFIDTHAHWFEIKRGVMDIQNWSFLANVAYGVTAGLDVQTGTNDMFAYQDLADMGEIIGPRAYSTGPGIFSDNNFQSLEEAKSVLERYKKHYRTHNLKSYIVGNRKQRQWVVQASHELEMMPTTEGGLDLKLDLTHVLDGFSGNEHNLPIVPLYDDVVQLVARSKIGYTPTLLVTYGGPWAENHYYTTEAVHDDPKLNRFTPHEVIDGKSLRVPWFHADEYSFPAVAAQAAKIIRAGGRVGIGAHGQLQGLGYHWEMWSLASGGVTPLEVLRCATLGGAEIIGLSEDLGSIEPGKLADLVVLSKNPLDDIRNTNTVKLVMKNGELLDADTLDALWPEERKLEPLWWWSDAPTN
jgi:Tol biopolymer transport system component